MDRRLQLMEIFEEVAEYKDTHGPYKYVNVEEYGEYTKLLIRLNAKYKSILRDAIIEFAKDLGIDNPLCAVEMEPIDIEVRRVSLYNRKGDITNKKWMNKTTLVTYGRFWRIASHRATTDIKFMDPFKHEFLSFVSHITGKPIEENSETILAHMEGKSVHRP